jgi:hypothetical protein
MLSLHAKKISGHILQAFKGGFVDSYVALAAEQEVDLLVSMFHTEVVIVEVQLAKKRREEVKGNISMKPQLSPNDQPIPEEDFNTIYISTLTIDSPKKKIGSIACLTLPNTGATLSRQSRNVTRKC